LLLALRCPIFRGSNAAVVKLSNLLLLLNNSKGKNKISEQFRAKGLVLFRVNPVTAAAAAAAASTNASTSSKRHNDTGDAGAGRGFIGSAHKHQQQQQRIQQEAGVGSGAARAGAEAGSASKGLHTPSSSHHHHHDHATALHRHREDSPTHGIIPILPTASIAQPETVPFYDIATHAIVQVRRKKPMAELKDRMSM
jgi:hypothetical protein